MISTIFLLILCLASASAMASERQRINPIGSSAKGQFVAFEEYAFVPAKKVYVVSIRIMNVWTKEFVGEKVSLVLPARKPHSLKSTREKVLLMAKDQLVKFKIST